MSYKDAVFKAVAVSLLLATFLLCAFVSLAFVPIILASRRSMKRYAIVQAIPLSFLAGLIWKLCAIPHAVHPGFDGVGRRRRITKQDYEDIPF